MNGFPGIPPAATKPTAPPPASAPVHEPPSSVRSVAALFTVMLFGVAMMLPPAFAGQHLVSQALAAAALTVAGFALAAALGWITFTAAGKSLRAGAIVFSAAILASAAIAGLISTPGLRIAGPWLERAGVSRDTMQALAGQTTLPKNKLPAVRVYRQQPTAAAPSQP